MRALGVDFGDSRTGVAVSDPMGWTARGLEAVHGGADKVVKRIAQLAREFEAKTIVVGYPINMDGTAGFRAVRTDDFIAALTKHLSDDGVKIVKWDERLTSVEAARIMKESGARPASRAVREKGKLDILSAAILLQSYLDSGGLKINMQGVD